MRPGSLGFVLFFCCNYHIDFLVLVLWEVFYFVKACARLQVHPGAGLRPQGAVYTGCINGNGNEGESSFEKKGYPLNLANFIRIIFCFLDRGKKGLCNLYW